MKRITIFAVIIMLLSSVFASNLQKIYTIRDNTYKRVEALCSRAGVIGPSSFSPMSARSLQIALDRIDPEKLNEKDKIEYERLYSEITEDDYLFDSKGFGISPIAGVNLGINIANYSNFEYGNTSAGTPQPDRREETLIPYRYEDAALSLGAKMKFGNNVYLEAIIDLKNRSQMMQETTFGWLYTTVIDNEGKLLTGIPGEWPYRAGGSFGNDYVSFILGRFPHSMGSGISGNMLVGDNFAYQEIVALSFMSNYFTYNMSLTRFDQQKAVRDGSSITEFSRNEFSGDQQYRVVHRFDVNIVNKVRFVLNLATLYNSSNAFDIRFFYPFVITHNYYNYTNDMGKQEFDEANNLLSIEAEWNIIKGLTFSAQVAIDQMQMSWEDNTALPAAYGILGNLKYNTNIGNGTLNSYFEVAYTNPYLYLNGKRDSNGNLDYNLDYVVGYHAQYLDDYGYTGYIYGSDTIAFSLGTSYAEDEDLYEVGANILYRIKGKKGLKHYSPGCYGTIVDMEDAAIEEDSNVFMNASTPTGGWKEAEHLLKLALYVKYNIIGKNWGKVTIYGAFGFNTYFNYAHHVGDTEFMPQLLLGAKYSY